MISKNMKFLYLLLKSWAPLSKLGYWLICSSDPTQDLFKRFWIVHLIRKILNTLSWMQVHGKFNRHAILCITIHRCIKCTLNSIFKLTLGNSHDTIFKLKWMHLKCCYMVNYPVVRIVRLIQFNHLSILFTRSLIVH